MRWFLKLSYRGAPFHGWQSQPNATSIQQTVEEALTTILRRNVAITGAGRTDTGVNARVMYAHFDASESELPEKKRLLTSLNRMCGRDIALEDLLRVKDDAHARFDALSRTYKYFATTSKSPFFYPLSWQAPCNLDLKAMNQAAEILLDTSDFTSFAKLHTDTKTNICHVSVAEWSEIKGGLCFTITADRFLRNMVRAVVGTLVEVGRGKITTDEFENIVAQKDRCAAGTSMPGNALYLWDIVYPQEIFIS